MNSRARIMIPAGILVASSGLSPSWTQISLPTWSFGGGSVFSLGDQSFQTKNSKKLGLEDKKVKNLDKKDHSKTTGVNLELQEGTKLDSSTFRLPLKVKNSRSKVLATFKEVEKEVAAHKIDNQSQLKIRESQAKLNPQDRRQFNVALQKVKTYSDEETKLLNRGYRPVEPHIQKITEQEKKAVSDLFTQFVALDTSSGNFSGELSQLIGEKENKSTEDSVCLSCIPNHLQKIGWVNKELNLFEKKSSVRQNSSRSHQYYSSTRPLRPDTAKNTWGEWNNPDHPYRYRFPSEAAWLYALSRISNYWQAYHDFISNKGRLTCSALSIGVLCFGDKQSLEETIDETKAELELKIGLKLMKLMQRL